MQNNVKCLTPIYKRPTATAGTIIVPTVIALSENGAIIGDRTSIIVGWITILIIGKQFKSTYRNGPM